ncbi:MAG: hypothetical protein R3F24_00590 [Gammaproteobacteria bacterium]
MARLQARLWPRLASIVPAGVLQQALLLLFLELLPGVRLDLLALVGFGLTLGANFIALGLELLALLLALRRVCLAELLAFSASLLCGLAFVRIGFAEFRAFGAGLLALGDLPGRRPCGSVRAAGCHRHSPSGGEGQADGNEGAEECLLHTHRVSTRD